MPTLCPAFPLPKSWTHTHTSTQYSRSPRRPFVFRSVLALMLQGVSHVSLAGLRAMLAVSCFFGLQFSFLFNPRTMSKPRSRTNPPCSNRRPLVLSFAITIVSTRLLDATTVVLGGTLRGFELRTLQPPTAQNHMPSCNRALPKNQQISGFTFT